MATTVQVELQAKTDKAIQEIEGLQQEIKNLSKQVDQANKNTSEGLKDVKETSEQTAGGISKIGTAIKAAGIGLAVAAFAKLIRSI
jgi:methyl-accepting chemotaxis protein